jgi:autotransporter-associated beta strand protein
MMMRHFDGVTASAVRSRLQLLPLAAGAAATLGSMVSPALGQTWIGGASGNFSVSTNWLGNVAPALGTTGTPTNLTFSTGSGSAIAANNNLGSPWVANSLTFNTNNSFTLGGNSATDVFQLVGPSASISMNGLANATMATGTAAPSWGAAVQLAGNVIFGGTGIANLYLGNNSNNAGVSQTGGSYSITVTGGAPLRILRCLSLCGNNTFSGGLILDGGTVMQANPSASNANMFGFPGSTLTVTSNGGTINLANTNAFSALNLGTIQLNGDLHLVGLANLHITNSGVPPLIQGGGTIYVHVAGSKVMVASNSTGDVNTQAGYYGAVVIDQAELAINASTQAGALLLQSVAGANRSPEGALTGAASYDVRAGGELQAKNNQNNTLQNGDRINDNAPMRLSSGLLTLIGPAPLGSNGYSPQDLTEKVGDITGTGNNALSVTATTVSTPAVITTLEPKSLARAQRGTFVLRGTSLGDGTTTSRGRIILDTALAGSDFVGGSGAAGSKNINILTYGVGGSSGTDNGSGFVTYGSDGFRLLNTSTEYDAAGSGSTLAPLDPTNNVRLTGATANAATTTLNSLLLAGGSVTGTGTLNITSGAVLGSSSISNNLAFGNVEGVIWTNGMAITGQLSGTNGLTKSGGTLTLTADNHNLTGPLTINAGTLQYNQDLALPGDGQIVVSSAGVGGAGLQWTGVGAATTLSRNVAVNTGTFSFSIATNAGNMHLAGTISGAGNVNLQSAAGGEVYVDNTANTYTGTTRFGGGNIHIAADGSTGSGGQWEFAGGALVAEGAVTNSRAINFEASSTIDTKSFNVTLGGPMTAYGADGFNASVANTGFTKNGAGTLNLTSPANNISGIVTVNAGTLLINGNLGPSNNLNSVTVNSGATLGGSGTIYRNTVIGQGATLSPGNSPGILTIWGNLNMAASVAPAATLIMELNGPVAGTGYDQVQVFGQNGAPAVAEVQLGGDTPATQATNLQLHLGYAPTPNSVFWLITNTNNYLANLGAANTTTGTFAGLPEGSTVTLGSFGGVTFTGSISYKGDYATSNPAAGNGNDVVIYNVHGCGSADFNCDGDVGTDLDIEAFFSCLAGSCPPPPCANSADFNGDGDIGTDADIEAFFRVLAGGSC